MHEFEEAACAYCESPTSAINLDGCLICETFQSACAECMAEHRKSHSAVEIEDFRREMFEEQPLTEREKVNLMLKSQIRNQAESICKLIDAQEGLLKNYEHQCKVLAAEVDRLRPVQ